MRALITNPEQYASKLVNDEPATIQFKNDKTIAALQQMLTKMCSSPPIAAPSSNAHVRQLAQQLVDPSSSAGLQPPACSAPIVSLPNQPSSSMHTVRGAAAEELNITNALMDMILSRKTKCRKCSISIKLCSQQQMTLIKEMNCSKRKNGRAGQFVQQAR
jgi:hypothetical protein